MKKQAFITTLAICFLVAAHAEANEGMHQEKDAQVMYKAGTQKSFKGPANLFTGEVEVQILFPANETAHYSGAYVTFQPGARTNWHYHPAGQHMLVTSGIGLTGT